MERYNLGLRGKVFNVEKYLKKYQVIYTYTN